jgi:SSS family solute:Na+ symporter
MSNPLDLAVIVGYLVAVLAIGWWAQKHQHGVADYLLAGRRMPSWAAGVSILATSFSAAALVGGTAQGVDHGLRYWQLQLGDLLAFTLVAWWMMPAYKRLPITSAYEYLQYRYGAATCKFAAGIFVAQTLVRIGLLIYAPALVISGLLGISTSLAILLTAIVAICYSVSGGIAAVIWTDLMQVILIVLACLTALGTIAASTGGFTPLFVHAWDAGRFQVIDLTRGWHQAYSLPWTLVAYGVLALSVAGANQQPVQRYLSTPSLAAARRASLIAWSVGAIVMVLCLGLGIALQSRQTLHGGAALVSQHALANLVRELPPGLAGLMVAAVLAAAMSSLDSAMHSLATVTLVDFVLPATKQTMQEQRQLTIARILTLFYGTVGMVVAMIAAALGTDLLDTMVQWLGYFAGPQLALFLLGLFTRWSERPVLLGAITAYVGIAAAVLTDAPARVGVHALWLAPASLVLTGLTASVWVLASGTRSVMLSTPPSESDADLDV